MAATSRVRQFVCGWLMMGAAVGLSPAWGGDIDFGTSTAIHPEIWPLGASGVKRDPVLEARLAALLGRMSVEEKVGQIIQADIGSVTPDDVRTYHLGSILNGASSGPYGNDKAPAADWLKMADEFYAASVTTAPGRPVIPVIWGMDAVHGNTNILGATIFPHNIGLGAMHDPALMEKIGRITAEEVRIVGGDWTFAPTIAVVRNDRWGRTYESYSESPALVASYAEAIVTGIQGRPGTADFLKGPHVIATAKHFLGDGGTDDGRDQGDNTYSEEALRDLFSPPYQAAIAAGVQSVMASLSSWRGQKMHGSRDLLDGVLVKRLGLDGFVVGDWNGHAPLPGCNRSDCPAAVKAGVDMFMAPDGWKKLYENTLAEVKSGVLPLSRLDEAAGRILRVKLRAGILDAGKPSTRPLAGQYAQLGSPEHRAVARQAVRESLVLLKNDNAVLPLNPHGHILVAGRGADDLAMQSGGWTISWQGDGLTRADFPHATSIFEGIKANVEAAGGTAEWNVEGTFKNRPDVAIVVFGETPYAEFRGDRPDVGFADEVDLRLIRRLKDKGIPVVAVFLSGRPLYVTPLINAADAFVAAWLPGGEGAGVADVLIAKADGKPAEDFSGKLSFSWPRAPEQTALNVGQEPYHPLFSFGYGLSYAEPKTVGALPEAQSANAIAADHDNMIENGRAATGWSLFLYGAKGEKTVVDRPVLASADKTLKLSRRDRLRQEDTLAAVWDGGKASLALAGEAADFRHQLKEDMAVSLILRVDRAPSAPVSFGLGGKTLGHVDLTAALREAAGKGWVSMQVRLSCLAHAGADLSAVTVPLELLSAGKLAIGLHSARLDAAGKGGCVVTGQP